MEGESSSLARQLLTDLCGKSRRETVVVIMKKEKTYLGRTLSQQKGRKTVRSVRGKAEDSAFGQQKEAGYRCRRTGLREA